MSDSPRRRRSDDDTGGGLPLFPLIVIVIFAGLLLGGVLAHFFGGSGGAGGKGPTAVATALPPTPLPTPFTLATPRTKRTAPAFLQTASPSPTPALTPKPSPTASPARTKTASPAASATAPATHVAVEASLPPKTPAPVKTVTAARVTPVRAAAITPAPNYVAPGTNQAAGIVRSYLGALARGDRATATSYLASGLPGETFMSSDARIVSIHSVQTTNAQYRVTADVRASTGDYYVTFTLEPGSGGLQIVDHYSIRM